MSELEDLQRQNRALDEQIKTLVRVEASLHKSQNEVDRQVARIELLNRFALRWTSQATTTEILTATLELFQRLFNCEWIAVLVLDAHALGDETLDSSGPIRHPADPTALAEATGDVTGPVVATRDDFLREWPALGPHLPPSTASSHADGFHVLMPLRGREGPPMCVLLAAGKVVARSNHFKEAPKPSSLAFLQLMNSHVEHMLRTTRLLQDVARTQHHLEAARDELEDRVDARTRELRAEVHERRRAEEALTVARDVAEAASHAKSAFLAHMSHELRTPLNAIIGYSEMLHEDALSEGRLDDARDQAVVIASGKHLLTMVNDVLDLSKIEAGRLQLEAEPFDVYPVLEAVIGTARPLLERNSNRFELVTPQPLGVMVSDSIRLRQVLLNLLGNAAKFTQGGVVRLEVVRVDGDGVAALVFRVEDTGIGMTVEQVSRLFNEFSQADSSTTRKFGGTGLGLAISRRLSRLMGGDITVTSVLGRGTTFTVTLPANIETRVGQGDTPLEPRTLTPSR